MCPSCTSKVPHEETAGKYAAQKPVHKDSMARPMETATPREETASVRPIGSKPAPVTPHMKTYARFPNQPKNFKIYATEAPAEKITPLDIAEFARVEGTQQGVLIC